MISHVEGILDYKSTDLVVIDVGGVGYEVHVPSHIFDLLPEEGERFRLFTHTNFREEDGTSLYGFMSREDREFFRLLITVSGIGPKVALSIMSDITSTDLSEAIVTEDLKRLTQVNGIGKKTAQRLVLELKDKVAEISLLRHEKKPEAEDAASRDAAEALVALGYSRQESAAAVTKAREASPAAAKVEELIKASLRYL